MNVLLSTFALVLSLGSGLLHPAVEPVRWPLDPRPQVVARFDPPGSAFSAGHRGVDLLGRPGEPVLAPLAGTITFAGNLAGRGVVVIDHGSRRTTYEPVHAAVHAGDVVARGQVIGTLEVALSHCFPRSCLHWGLIVDGQYRDPLELLGGSGHVRLLPLEPLSVTPADAPAGTRSGAVPW
ncbi:MAG: Peptidase family [Marmoricola sp.]|nr:Peptidase family [Marmoricola sp.]